MGTVSCLLSGNWLGGDGGSPHVGFQHLQQAPAGSPRLSFISPQSIRIQHVDLGQAGQELLSIGHRLCDGQLS